MTEVGEGRLYLVTPAEYATLYDGGAKDGTVTSNGVTYAWDDNAVYAQIPQFGTGLDLDEDYLITLAAATEFSLGGVMAAVPWDATATLPVQISESGAMYVDALSTAAAAASFISAVTAYSGTSKTLSLAVTKNGVTTNVTVPYATSAMYGTDSSGQSDENPISSEYIHRPSGSYSDEAYAVYDPIQEASQSYSILASATGITDASTDLQLATAKAVYNFAANAGKVNVTSGTGNYYLTGVTTMGDGQTIYANSAVYENAGELYANKFNGSAYGFYRLIPANYSGDFKTDFNISTSSIYALTVLRPDSLPSVPGGDPYSGVYETAYSTTLVMQTSDTYFGLCIGYNTPRVYVWGGQPTNASPSWHDRLGLLGTAQTWTAAQTFNAQINTYNVLPVAASTYTLGSAALPYSVLYLRALTLATSAGGNIEIGRTDGTASTPYIDFHTDGLATTDYNIRIMADGNVLKIAGTLGSSNIIPVVTSVYSLGSNSLKYLAAYITSLHGTADYAVYASTSAGVQDSADIPTTYMKKKSVSYDSSTQTLTLF